MKVSRIIYLIIALAFFSCESTEQRSDNSILGLADVSNEAAENMMEEAEAFKPEEAKSTYEWKMGDGSAEEIDVSNTTTYFTRVYDDAQEAVEGTVQANASEPDQSQAPIQRTNDKIIRTAHVGLELKKYEKDKHAIYDAIKMHGAYISQENERHETYRISNSITIRVPNGRFDVLLDKLTSGEGIDHIDYKRTSAVDVGEEFYDLQARIKTKKAVEKRYQVILKQAKTIKEILSVEDQIRVIQEEIESKEGRLKYLGDRISLSTIHLEVYQDLEYDAPIAERPGFFNKLLKALQTGWNGILNFLIGVAYLWPLWLIIIGLLVLLRKKGFSIFKKRS